MKKKASLSTLLLLALNGVALVPRPEAKGGGGAIKEKTGELPPTNEKADGSAKGGRSGAGSARGAVSVRTFTAQLVEAGRSLAFTGTLLGRTQVDVYSKVLGRLKAQKVKGGDWVKAGQTLFEVDRSDPGESYLSTPVASPIAGWVGRWFVDDLGEQVTPQAPVVSVVDDRALRAAVQLPIRAWLQVKSDTKVTARFNDEERSGKILSIARAADPSSGRGVVDIEFANENSLWRSGMVAALTFELEPMPRLLIPAAALIITDSGAYVFLAEDGLARKVSVRFQLLSPDRVEIVEGLRDGSRVIVQGMNLVSDKTPIQVLEPE